MTVYVTKPEINIREELSALKKPTGVFGEQIMRSDSVDDFHSLMGQNRNIIINGDMSVDQRLSGATITNDSTTTTQGQYFSIDRWRTYHYNNSGAFDFIASTQQYSDHPESAQGKCLRVYIATGGPKPTTGVDFLTLRYNIEGYDSYHLTKTPMALSFWVKTTTPGVYGIQFRVSGGVGSASGNFCTTYTVTSANRWERITLSIPAQSLREITNGGVTGYSILFALASGLNETFDPAIAACIDKWGDYASDGLASSRLTNAITLTAGNYFQITNVQLERGPVATPFEYRSYATELALCQRYYQRITNENTNSGRAGIGGWSNGLTGYIGIHFPTRMRTIPVLISNNNGKILREGIAWYTVNSATISAESTSMFAVVQVSTDSDSGAAQGDVMWWGGGGGNFDIAFQAEV